MTHNSQQCVFTSTRGYQSYGTLRRAFEGGTIEIQHAIARSTHILCNFLLIEEGIEISVLKIILSSYEYDSCANKL